MVSSGLLLLLLVETDAAHPLETLNDFIKGHVLEEVMPSIMFVPPKRESDVNMQF